MHSLFMVVAMFVQITIARGDTLWNIAQVHQTTVAQILRDNPAITNPDKIYAGRKLVLRDYGRNDGKIADSKRSKSHPKIDATNVRNNNASSSGILVFSPCGSYTNFPQNITIWLVPNGCFSRIFYTSYGDCYGWISHNFSSLAQTRQPHIGNAVHFPPGRDGAGNLGHWAIIVAMRGDGWVLISEENMYWRGGGFNKVNYRFIRLTPDLIYYR